MDTPPLTNEDGEVRELTREDFARMRPAREALPEIFPPEMVDLLLRQNHHDEGL